MHLPYTHYAPPISTLCPSLICSMPPTYALCPSPTQNKFNKFKARKHSQIEKETDKTKQTLKHAKWTSGLRMLTGRERNVLKKSANVSSSKRIIRFVEQMISAYGEQKTKQPIMELYLVEKTRVTDRCDMLSLSTAALKSDPCVPPPGSSFHCPFLTYS